jgi:hypothetical protein
LQKTKNILPLIPPPKGGSFNPLFKEKNDFKLIKLSKRDSTFLRDFPIPPLEGDKGGGKNQPLSVRRKNIAHICNIKHN